MVVDVLSMTTIILELWSDPKQSMDQSIKIRFVSFDGVFLSKSQLLDVRPTLAGGESILFLPAPLFASETRFDQKIHVILR